MPICASGAKNRRAYMTAPSTVPISIEPSMTRRPDTSSTRATVTFPTAVRPVSNVPNMRIPATLAARYSSASSV